MFDEFLQRCVRLLGREIPEDTETSRCGADGRERLSKTEVASLFQSDLRYENVRFRRRSEWREGNGDASLDDNATYLLVATARSPLNASAAA